MPATVHEIGKRQYTDAGSLKSGLRNQLTLCITMGYSHVHYSLHWRKDMTLS